ncbi:hypothetical protein VM1G_00523 [Cytospora mali]|uniref:Uncharacterized protein n=1 Tax=Cytospora mali TaxID=578113 RepID=A0A194VNY1_CYTMA|nr:hypothetical protein VM1G_00523 [Valsa mali]
MKANGATVVPQGRKVGLDPIATSCSAAPSESLCHVLVNRESDADLKGDIARQAADIPTRGKQFHLWLNLKHQGMFGSKLLTLMMAGGPVMMPLKLAEGTPTFST